MNLYTYIVSNIIVFSITLVWYYKNRILGFLLSKFMYLFFTFNLHTKLFNFVMKNNNVTRNIGNIIGDIQKPEMSSSIVSSGGYSIPYKHLNKEYIIFVNNKRTGRRKFVQKPNWKVFSVRNNVRYNITNLFFKYYGPNCDFHQSEITPKVIDKESEGIEIMNDRNHVINHFASDQVMIITK